MPRKTTRDPHRRAAADLASMRPRPDAAENLIIEARPEKYDQASMRPRPDAAENHALVAAETPQGQVLQ